MRRRMGSQEAVMKFIEELGGQAVEDFITILLLSQLIWYLCPVPPLPLTKTSLGGDLCPQDAIRHAPFFLLTLAYNVPWSQSQNLANRLLLASPPPCKHKTQTELTKYAFNVDCSEHVRLKHFKLLLKTTGTMLIIILAPSLWLPVLCTTQ